MLSLKFLPSFSGYLMSLSTYFREAVSELHKVAWPTRTQAIRISGIVLAATFIAAAVFGAFDSALAWGYAQLLSLSELYSF
jgi:preprotein translocase SecE subunit